MVKITRITAINFIFLHIQYGALHLVYLFSILTSLLVLKIIQILQNLSLHFFESPCITFHQVIYYLWLLMFSKLFKDSVSAWNSKVVRNFVD